MIVADVNLFGSEYRILNLGKVASHWQREGAPLASLAILISQLHHASDY